MSETVLSCVEENYSSCTQEQTVDEAFLHVFKNYPWLFDKGNDNYKDKNVSQNSWEEVTAQTHESRDKCEKRWERLQRSFYVESDIRAKEYKSGNEAAKKREVFPLYDIIKDMLTSAKAMRLNTSNFKVMNNCNTKANNNCKDYMKPNSRQYTNKTFSKENKNHKSLLNRALTSHQAAITRIEAKFNATLEKRTREDPCDAARHLILCELNRLSPKSARAKRNQLMKLCYPDE